MGPSPNALSGARSKVPPMLGSGFMEKALLSRRTGNLAGVLACAGMLAFGYYLQFVDGLEPCPLCILQRLMLLATGIAFLVAAIHHPKGRPAAAVYAGVI